MVRRISMRAKQAVFFFAVVSLLAAASIPASARTAPMKVKLQRGSATATTTVESEHVSMCEGADGEYFDVSLRVRGTMESADERLAGDFTGQIRGIFKGPPLSLDTLIGHGRDDFEVRDASGVVKARGVSFFVADGVMALKAMVFAQLRDGSTWIANTHGLNQLVSLPIVLDTILKRVGLPPLGLRGPFVAQIGGPIGLTPTDAGIIQSGSCPGLLDPNPFPWLSVRG